MSAGTNALELNGLKPHIVPLWYQRSAKRHEALA